MAAPLSAASMPSATISDTETGMRGCKARPQGPFSAASIQVAMIRSPCVAIATVRRMRDYENRLRGEIFCWYRKSKLKIVRLHAQAAEQHMPNHLSRTL